MKNLPKRAPKRGLTPRKLAIARAYALTNKCADTLAAIYGLTPRQVRRKIDFIKAKIGVDCRNELAHWLHAHGLGFTGEAERLNFLKQEEALRSTPMNSTLVK